MSGGCHGGNHRDICVRRCPAKHRDIWKQVLLQTTATLKEGFTWAVHIKAIDDSGSPDASGVADVSVRDSHRRERAFAYAAATEALPQDPSVELTRLWAALRSDKD